MPISRPNRGRPLSTRRISAASSLTGSAPAASSASTAALHLAGRQQQVDPRVGRDRDAADAADLGLAMGVLGRRAGRRARPRARAGPITETTARSSERSSIVTSRPILYIGRWRSTASPASASVSIKKPSAVRSTRMSPCIRPLRSSSAE